VVLEVRHVVGPLLLRREAVAGLALGEGIKPLSKALLWSHAIVVVAH
jgi:hypothetical protein